MENKVYKETHEVLVEVSIKKDVFDPEAETIKNALLANSNKDFAKITQLKQSHSFLLTIQASKEEAKKIAETAAKNLLANIVIEDFKVSYLRQIIGEKKSI